MAKKPKGEFNFDLDVNCLIRVPKEHLKSFQRDLKKGQISLTASLEVGSESLGFDIYADYIDGKMQFESVDPENYRLTIKGKYRTSDDFNALPAINKLSEKPKLKLDFVSDLDSNWYYIDGDEDKKIDMGVLSA